MDKFSVQKRDLTVKAKKLRSLGMVPGSVFGRSLPESIDIQMDCAAALKLIRQKREGSRLSLDIEGHVIPVQIKEKTVNTLTNELLHLSFQALSENDRVNSVIHLILINDEMLGGQIEKMIMEIPYCSLPADMIDTINVDAGKLKPGNIVTPKEIPELMSDKIELLMSADEILLRVNEKKIQARTYGAEE